MLPLSAVPEVSQHALARFAACERAFELAHLKRERWPAPDPQAERLDGQRRVAIGDAFHRLARLHARGHADEALAPFWEGPDGPEVEALYRRYRESEVARLAERVYSEQSLRVVAAGLRVLVRFDRLERLADGSWLITDWKTGRSFDPVAAASSWQTRLYRLALALGGSYFNDGEPIAPARIAVRYWHVPTGESHRFAYDDVAHAADRRDLADLAERIFAGLRTGFAPSTSHCPRCPYDSRCRTSEPQPAPTEAPALALPQFRFPGA